MVRYLKLLHRCYFMQLFPSFSLTSYLLRSQITPLAVHILFVFRFHPILLLCAPTVGYCFV